MITTDPTNADGILEKVVCLADGDAQETDPDLDTLTDCEEAVEALQLLGTLQAGVRQALQPELPDVDAEWQRLASRLQLTPQPPKRVSLRWRWVAAAAVAAAAVLLFTVVRQPSATASQQGKGYVAYVKQSGQQDIVLTVGRGVDAPNTHRDEINLSDKSNQRAHGATLSETGRLVLDYNNARRSGLSVSNEVEQNTVTIPLGKEFQIVFADGTRVWLHANSRLTYPSRFTGAERRVFLQGEAYFEVAKDPVHPFVIHTDQMEARVLGTELNVSCYPGQESHVALITGRVQLTAPDVHPVTLQPSQGASLTDKGFETQEENIEPYLNWRKGYIYFDEAQLVDVVTELGRWYNIDVIIENQTLMNRHVRFFFPRNEPVQRAVELLNTFHEFNAVIADGKLYIKDL